MAQTPKELPNSHIVAIMSAIENDRAICDRTAALYELLLTLSEGDTLTVVEDENDHETGGI